jgi:hypothetical protein
MEPAMSADATMRNIWTQRRKAAKEKQSRTFVEFVPLPGFLRAFASLRRDFRRLSAVSFNCAQLRTVS